jgi:glutaredoxin 3
MDIIVYTKTGCPWCNGVIEYLDNAAIEYEEREVTANPKYMEEMKQKSGQDKAPTLDIDGHILADSDKDQVDAYLKEKGLI